MTEHANTRFHIGAIPDTGILDHYIDTLTHRVMRLRRNYAYANGISIWETVADITPDPDRPNVIIITIRACSADPGPRRAEQS